MPSNQTANQFFRILALDGASTTGGMGWMSIGVIRDYLHRYLQLSQKSLKSIQAPLKPLPNQDHFLKKFREQRCFPKRPEPCPALTFLEQLNKVPKDSIADLDLHLMALWMRYQITHPYPKGKRTGPPISPIITELAIMRLALHVFNGTTEAQSQLISDLRYFTKADRLPWRETAALKSEKNFVPIHQVETALEAGISDVISLLLDHPEILLALRWVTGIRMPEYFREHFRYVRNTLSSWIRSGHLGNQLFSDFSKIDLLAGTSSGGLNALVLAKHNCLENGIDEALKMWTGLTASAPNTASEAGRLKMTPRSLMAMLGRCSFFGKDSVEVYESHFGQNQTMADLTKDVAITTVQLDSGEMSDDNYPILRRWKPVVYHNLEARTTDEIRLPEAKRKNRRKRKVELEDYEYASDQQFAGIHQFPESVKADAKNIRLLDVARYTSNLPILSNVYRGPNLFAPPENIQRTVLSHNFEHNNTSGFLDGGFYANNPSLAAITTALNQGIDQNNIVVVSLGNGRQAHGYAELANEDLGYNSWLLKPGREGLLIDMMLDIGIDAVNAYCATVLRPAHRQGKFVGGRYLRNDLWTDTLFMKDLLRAKGRDSLEFKIDEALGYQRYIYDRSELLNDFFTRYWGENNE